MKSAPLPPNDAPPFLGPVPRWTPDTDPNAAGDASQREAIATAADGSRLVMTCLGRGSPSYPFVLTLDCFPAGGAPPRLPSIVEIWSAVRWLGLAGVAMVLPPFVCDPDADAPDPDERGSRVQIAQAGAQDGSPAALRASLDGLGTRPGKGWGDERRALLRLDSEGGE